MTTYTSEKQKAKSENWILNRGIEHFLPRQGALTLCMGEQTGGNILQSLEAAAALSRKAEYGPVLYINTVQTTRQLGNSIRAGIDPEFSMTRQNRQLFFLTTPPGLLSAKRDTIEDLIKELKPKTIIVNSLDVSSKDYRRKEELLYTVMTWLGEYDLSILLFSELRKNTPKQGKIDRGGGVGKFGIIAEEIFMLEEGEEKSMVDSRLSIVGEKEASIADRQSSIVGHQLNKEEISVEGLSVDSNGMIEEASDEVRPASSGLRHYPMSNRYRKLVNEYQKKYGKQQKVGETYREMFDRVCGICLGGNSSLKLKAESLNGIGENVEEENAVCEMLSD